MLPLMSLSSTSICGTLLAGLVPGKMKGNATCNSTEVN